jgi:hypothetical protein
MSDPITEAAAMLAAHPDPMVRLIAERLAGARVRHRAAGLSRDDVARRIGCRGRSSPGPSQSWGSSGHCHWRVWVVSRQEFLPETGAECAVVEGTADLE